MQLIYNLTKNKYRYVHDAECQTMFSVYCKQGT